MTMTKGELKELAIKHLNKKNVQSIKKQLCKQQFVDRKQKMDCMNAFDKGFIKSFISSRKTAYKIIVYKLAVLNSSHNFNMCCVFKNIYCYYTL